MVGPAMVKSRHRALVILLLAAAAALAPVGALAAPAVAGCPVFPADNVWNTDISGLPVHAQSSAWLSNMGGAGRKLHPDFGSSGDPSAPYGIPYTVVDSSHAKVPVNFQYSGESDHVPYPLGPDTPIEGGQGAGGDRHALMLDRGSCTLYELYDTHYSAGGSTAGSGAVFNLRANGPLRPATWTSADAAGLPIFPGLLRRDEVEAGAVSHAIRFTAQQTDRKFIWPARHQAGSSSNAALPPMGARFRLQAGFDISHFSAATRVVLTAMKHYGLILADNGSNWYFQGAADNGWNDTMISEMKSIPAGAFDAVDESSIMLNADSGQARQPGGAPPAATAARPPVRAAAPAPAAADTPPATASPDAETAFDRHERALVDPVAPADASLSDHGGGAIATGGASRQSTGLSPPIVGVVVLAAAVGLVAAGAWLWRRRARPQ